MKKHVFQAALVLTLLFFLGGFHPWKDPLQEEKYEVEVRLVLVDVIVTKDGEFVTDLTKEDFELFEDGERVPIHSFELISFGERVPQPVGEKPEVPPPGVPRKQLVVVFDGVNSWQRHLKEGARKVVDELVSLAKLGHEVMVVQLSTLRGLEVLQSFTTDENLIRKALVRASGSIWFDRTLDAIKMWEEVGLSFEEAEEEAGAISEYYEQRMHPALEQEYLFREKDRFEQSLGGILAVANMIKDSPGRKTILLISDGFPDLSARTLDSIITETTPEKTVSGARTPHLDIRKDAGKFSVFDPFNILEKKKIMNAEEVLRELIRFANAQNISIYALDPDSFTKDLVPVSAERGPRELMMQTLEFRTQDKISRVQNLRWISEDTGGVSLRGAKRFDRFYAVMSTDLNYYYQLSYYPPREKPDDRYHKIKVKVKRSGVDVRHRKGYTDFSEEGEEKMLLVSAFYNPELFKKIPFEAEFVPFQTKKEKFEPWMNIALPAKELFIKRNVPPGPKKFELHIWVKGQLREDRAFGGKIPIAFNVDSSFMDLARSTDYLVFHYKGPEIEFRQKKYEVIFALCDEQTNEIGTWQAEISFPDFKKEKQGAVINCVLGLVSENPKKAKKSFSLSREDGCLEYGKIRFYPSVTNRFQRMQNASVFLQAYLPQGKPKELTRFTVIRKDGIALPVKGEAAAESWDKKSRIWSGIFNLDMQMVFPGDYSFKVSVPVSKEGPVLSKETRLTKLPY